MKLLDLLTVVVLGWFGSRLFLSFRYALRGPARTRARELVTSLRLRHFVPVPFLLVAVVGAAVALTQVPGLDFGWWTAIGGQGNPAFGVTDQTAGTALELIIPILFVALLIPALPLLVEREEIMFRLGAEDWTGPKRVTRAIFFGLVHAVIGIPIGVALALSIGGMWFTGAYLRGFARGGRQEALLESTHSHLAYNAVIVSLVAASLIVEVVLSGLGV